MNGHLAHVMHRNLSFPSIRPHQGKAVSHRRLYFPRAGSPTNWAPRLATPQSGREVRKADNPSPPVQISISKIEGDHNLPNHSSSCGSCKPRNHKQFPVFSLPSTCTLVQMGETTLGIAHMGTCQVEFYSGPIRLTPEIMVHAVHCSGLNPSLDPREQTTIWMMTCAPITVHEDLKVLLRKGLSKLCPPGIVIREYEALQF